MKSNLIQPNQKDYGVGVGLRSPHFSIVLESKPKTINWVEIISENYFPLFNENRSSKLSDLLKVREIYPIAMHGVSLNLGSTDPLNTNYLTTLKNLITEVEPFIVSDHLSWAGVNQINCHDLFPLPYIQESLENIVIKIDQVQNFLGGKILIENPSTYIQYLFHDFSETEFINTITQKTGCGLLLDINNVYVCSVNHGFDPKDYIKKINTDSIDQIHLAGHSKKSNFIIDTHDQPVSQEVWDLFTWFTKQNGKLSTMLERDDNIPNWSELEFELLKIKEIRDEKLSTCEIAI